MSSSFYNNNRTILKGKRRKNNPFNEKQSTYNSTFNYHVRHNKSHDSGQRNRQGTKRTNTSPLKDHEPKKQHTHTEASASSSASARIPLTSTPSRSLNIAEKRLQNLRHSLKRELNESTVKKTTNNNLNNSIIVIDDSPLNLVNLPESPPKKNIALMRMERIREKNRRSLEEPPPLMDQPQAQTDSEPGQSNPKSVNKNLVNTWNDHHEYNRHSIGCNSDSMLVNVNDSVGDLFKVTNLDESEDMDWNSSFEKLVHNENDNTAKETPPVKLKNLCIIVDTNLFLHNIEKLEDVLCLRVASSAKPIIYIPWMVITELDYIKDSSPNPKLNHAAVIAIRFINNQLKASSPRIIGQTVFAAGRQKCLGTGPDDKIISCCFQALETYENILLLSNDVNLRNKALVNNIPTCSAMEAVMKVVTKVRKNIISQKIMMKMGLTCSAVIIECVKVEYGNGWDKKEMLRSQPPWTFKECLSIFGYHWHNVFRKRLLKQFTKTVETTRVFFMQVNYICDDSKDLVEFTKLCVNLLIFLKDIAECRQLVEKTMQDITEDQ